MAEPTLSELLQAADDINRERMTGKMSGMVPRQPPQQYAGPDTTLGGLLMSMGMPGAGEAASKLADFTNSSRDLPVKAAQELTFVPGLVRSGEAVGKAANDPTIPNITRAGVETAASLGRILPMGAAAAGGLSAALLKDLGAFDTEAKAADRPGLTPEQNAEADSLEKMIRRDRFRSDTDRGVAVSRLQKLQGLSDASVKANNDAEAAARGAKAMGGAEEYNRAVQRAEVAKNEALAEDRKASKTEIGKVWNELGGWGPAAVGGTMAAIARVPVGSSRATNYIAPLAEGGLAGGFSTNIPLAFDAYGTEVVNPEKKAYEAYARELPVDHPRRAEWQQYADKLPMKNPVREEAQKELWDPWAAGKRMLFGAGEGAAGGLTGANIVRSVKAIPGTAEQGARSMGNLLMDAAEGVASVPGRMAASYNKSMGKAATEKGIADEARAASRGASQQQGVQSQQQQSGQRTAREADELAPAESTRVASSSQTGAVKAGGPNQPAEMPVGLDLEPVNVTPTNQRTSKPPARQTKAITDQSTKYTKGIKDEVVNAFKIRVGNGQDPMTITARDVAGNTNVPLSTIDDHVRKLQAVVNAMPEGSTRGDVIRALDRIRAIKGIGLGVAATAGASQAMPDDTSPTGHRHADGRFAPAP